MFSATSWGRTQCTWDSASGPPKRVLRGGATASGRLRYAGHVGGGFTDKELTHVWGLLKARAAETSPFDGPLPANEKPHWVRPELVAEITYLSWSEDGLLRHTVFVGLREDKPANDVRREQPGL